MIEVLNVPTIENNVLFWPHLVSLINSKRLGMRIILLTFVAVFAGGCSHSPAVYTPSRMLIDNQHSLHPKLISEQDIQVSDTAVMINGKVFPIAEHYTSALNHECVRYFHSDDSQATALSSVCQIKEQIWLPIETLF